jgi:amino-acid N-acetyltransferase
MTTTQFVLKKAAPGMLPALQHFLVGMNLPVSDLPADLSGFTLAYDGDELVGTAGMELLGSIGLLRSVAVAETHRSRQLGRQLFSAALDHAGEHGVQEVFLITNTADAYFEKNGFQRVDRGEVPAEIAETAQFTGLCPSSAVVMKKRIA